MKLFQKKANTFTAMIEGESIPIEEVPDEVFSAKIIGDGIAIIPKVGKLYAPCDGVISMVMERTKHAIGLINVDGMEVLLHVGLDTVNLMGEGFQVHVQPGDHVVAGDLLLSFDVERIHEAGINLISMLLVVEANGHILTKKYTHRSLTVGDLLLEYR